MATGQTGNRKLPGVYVAELSAFPPSVIGVPTAVPIFIGYTETAQDPATGQSLYLRATPIGSMDEFRRYFGGGFTAQGVLVPWLLEASGGPASTTPAIGSDFEAGSSDGTDTRTRRFVVATAQAAGGPLSFVAQFNLFQALQLFYANGGGDCLVISVANYQGTQDNGQPTAGAAPAAISRNDLLAGLAVARDTRGGTMLVVPEACLLFDSTTSDGVTSYSYDDYAAVTAEMIEQAGDLQDRMAILDLPGALIPDNRTVDALQETANAFYAAVAPAAAGFSYAACYAPALATSLLDKGSMTYASLKGSAQTMKLMNNLLTTQALALWSKAGGQSGATYSSTFVNVAAHIAAAFPVPPEDVIATADAPAGTTGVTKGAPHLLVSMTPSSTPPLVPVPATDAETITLDNFLTNTLPLLGTIKQILASQLNVAPPSGAVAGIYAQSDNQIAVWNAPANLAVASVIQPVIALNDAEQGGFNVPANGNAINILRDFRGRGTVVWGARTLDGNSEDLRYIQVRRTLIYVEQSIKSALQSFAFAPNDAHSWASATAMISSFLTGLWTQGGLMGSKAEEAFTVSCGLGSTMTEQDLVDGRMIVSVCLQIVRPAEFITLDFEQAMQAS
jgi:hypothetical protein